VSFRVRQPEHFIVEEIAAYPPTGEGEHVFIWIEKRGLTTLDAVAAICQALGGSTSTAGYAGMKDRVAIARQWISVFGTTPEAARGLVLPGVTVLDARRHSHRLRTGHLRGNRFTITVKALDDLADRMSALAQTGFPNRYGGQRFARRNVERARDWLLHRQPAPRDRRERRMIVSALQAHAFNAVIDERVARAMLSPIDGDLCERGVPTGPLPGWRMPSPPAQTTARILEDEVLTREGIDLALFRQLGRIGRGGRRALIAQLQDWSLAQSDDAVMRLQFTLAAGCYATVVLDAIGAEIPE
jgi:tRNA pseudouridine13 synthase